MDHLEHLLATCDWEMFLTDQSERMRWIAIWKTTAGRLRNGDDHGDSVSANTLDLIRNVSYNQQILAQLMLKSEEEAKAKMVQLERSLQSLRLQGGVDTTTQESRVMIAKRGRQSECEEAPPPFCTSLNSSKSVITLDEADEHLRDWFVANISHPFPDKPTKQTFSSQTGMDSRQLNTWFTNMRRRSNWTEYLKTYAGGNKTRFMELVQAAEKGEGEEGLKEVVQQMKRYVEKKPRGKVGDWLLNIIEEGSREETSRPQKKQRIERCKQTSDDHRLSKPEYTIAPPRAFMGTERPTTPTREINESEESSSGTEEESSDPDLSTSPEQRHSTPPKPVKPVASKPEKQKTIKTYTFDVGASAETPTKTPSHRRRRPTTTCRPSPLRNVSSASDSSLQAVDNGLRSVSGSSSTTASASVSSDLNFTFPTYNVQTTRSPNPPAASSLPKTTMPGSYANYPPAFPFGLPETNSCVFNPNLPTFHPSPYYHPSIQYPSYQPPMLYPPIELTMPHAPMHQQFAPFQPANMRFSDTFGSMKRGIEAVSGVAEEGRMYKMPRMGEM